MNRGGICWKKLDYQSIERLQGWSDVVLNDSQVSGPENIVTYPVADLRDTIMDPPSIPRVWLSINALSVFVDSAGKPSVYWPMQGRLWETAQRYAGWMYDYGPNVVLAGHVEESAPWGRVRFFDLSNRTLGHAIAYEMAAAAQYVDGIFLDEAHSTIADIRGRHPGVTITDEAWCNGLKFILRQYALLMGGRPKPVITNGTFGRENSSIVSGRFWQATAAADLDAKVADSEGASFTMLHSCGDMATPAQLAAACGRIEALGGKAAFQWTPVNGVWTYDWIPEAGE